MDDVGHSVMGSYKTDKGQIMAWTPVTEKEVQAYRDYPDTFFGRRRRPTGRARDVVELFEFFYEVYRETPREKLLEFFKGASDLARLEQLSQQDLAIEYCERTARAGDWRGLNGRAAGGSGTKPLHRRFWRPTRCHR